KVELPVYGEIGVTVKLLNQALNETKFAAKNQRPEIAEQWDLWRKEKQRRTKEDRGKGLASAAVIAAMNRQFPTDAIIALDVGNSTYSFGRYFESSQQTVLLSGYLGSIGFGYPAAIGAWAAQSDRPIIAITGDGGYAQYMGELCTAVKYGMKIKHFLFKNNELGKISNEQRTAGFPIWETDLHNPDFAEYAESCGALGIRVAAHEQLAPAIKQALMHDGPALVEIMTDPELI
ncbi:MAG: thiamine pyrophosphate-dependent enzyme, partial [Pseudomonadota bacterium]